MDKEKMININANLVDEPVFSSFEKDGKEVQAANFTLLKKYGTGKGYTKCSVYAKKHLEENLYKDPPSWILNIYSRSSLSCVCSSRKLI